MELREYIKDARIAEASEIYNAKFNSVEDAATLLERIASEKSEFDRIIYEFNTTLYNIKVGLSKLAYSKERLMKLHQFNESHIASLIKLFIENNTPERLDAIKRDIEMSNDFGVRIIPEWKPGDGERMYGVPSGAFIHVNYTETYYTFNNWDIDKDIQRNTKVVEELESAVREYIDRKSEMYDKYGFDALIMVFSNFEKTHGPLKADSKWSHWDFVSYNQYDESEEENDPS